MMRASRTKRVAKLGSTLNIGDMTLSATSRSKLSWIARYTVAMPPAPSSRRMRYPGMVIGSVMALSPGSMVWVMSVVVSTGEGLLDVVPNGALLETRVVGVFYSGASLRWHGWLLYLRALLMADCHVIPRTASKFARCTAEIPELASRGGCRTPAGTDS